MRIVQEIKDLFMLLFIASMILVTFLFGVGSSMKLLNQGNIIAEGVVLSHEVGPIQDCVEISKTTVGESSIEKFCVFDSIKNMPSVGDKIEINYTKSPWLFMNRIKVETICKKEDLFCKALGGK